MLYNWIDKTQFSIDYFLLMDRWIIRMLINSSTKRKEYADNLAIALAAKPYVAWYCKQKAPEIKEVIEKLVANAPKNVSDEILRQAEEFIVEVTETSIVYTVPEIMNSNCNYIYNWDEQRLLNMIDFTDKIVLDVGSGTGRLAFAAAKVAKRVYASEPTDMLREFMRDKIECEAITNVRVVDGTVENIPYEDNTFDIVMSAHVIGDHYDTEIAELTRVVKSGGYIIDCRGDDDIMREKPDTEMIKRGFEYLYHKSSLGGDIYRYRKKVVK